MTLGIVVEGVAPNVPHLGSFLGFCFLSTSSHGTSFLGVSFSSGITQSWVLHADDLLVEHSRLPKIIPHIVILIILCNRDVFGAISAASAVELSMGGHFFANKCFVVLKVPSTALCTLRWGSCRVLQGMALLTLPALPAHHTAS